MLIKWISTVSAMALVIVYAVCAFPDEAGAAFIFKMKSGSIDCEFIASGGGPPTENDAFICGVNLKEIAGFCRNKPGNSGEAQGQPFQLVGGVIKTAGTDTWVKARNGKATTTVSISNDEILRIIDIWNAEHPDNIINLQQGACPNKNWTFEWRVSKADAVITHVRIPTGGSAAYLQNTNCRPVTLYEGTPQEETITVCDFDKEPFKYCTRIPASIPNGPEFDSGLRVYSGPNGTGVMQGLPDKDYSVKNCYLFRDVNKDNAFNLSAFGTYLPDISNIVAPQTGNVDGGDDDNLGGIVLVSPFLFYTGTCHQHGREKGNNNTWQQLGPIHDGSDPICTGGSQLLDGTYP